MSKTHLNIIGGGLWGGLLAYGLKQHKITIPFRLIEQDSKLGGNHTWSFHGSDISSEAMEWIGPLISHSWNGYDVRFPAHQKSFESAYHTITSDHFHKVITQALKEDELVLNTSWAGDFSDVVDARGINTEGLQHCGFQKFVGLEVELTSGHGLTRPCLMDATVTQIDGYRFIYYLPFGPNNILVEDTRYSGNSHLAVSEIEQEVLAIIAAKGWIIKRVLRREEGVLPIPYGALASMKHAPTSVGGIFNDVTGYSFPDAVRLISNILKHQDLSLPVIQREIDKYRTERSSERRYLRLLNRMMFQAAAPAQRYRVLEHFYRLPRPLIESFYRGEINTMGKLRILMGRPPVPVLKAIRSIITRPSQAGLHES